jgi:hypothetical protein
MCPTTLQTSNQSLNLIFDIIESLGDIFPRARVGDLDRGNNPVRALAFAVFLPPDLPRLRNLVSGVDLHLEAMKFLSIFGDLSCIVKRTPNFSRSFAFLGNAVKCNFTEGLRSFFQPDWRTASLTILHLLGIVI